MLVRWCVAIASVVVALIPASADAASRPEEPREAPSLSFERDIRPIFREHCIHCHGEEDDPKAGLDLRFVRTMLDGGLTGEAIVPGDRDGSFLWHRVEDDEMPPGDGKLSADQKATLAAWIDAGARTLRPEPDEIPPPGTVILSEEDTDFWSFRPITRPELPEVEHADRVRSPIDAFLLDRLEAEGLGFAPEADRATLIRRLSLDLTGLPPTPEEVDAFLRDEAPDAYDRLVDRLLASPHYGERWAQHWLDVIRWAETWGFETNSPRPNAWPYRDWVIEAFNADMPYDRFVFEQLAGDTTGIDAATGFLVAGPANLPGQIGKDEESMRQARQDELDESVRTVGEAFLGLTVGCARCHNHKFDPITQRDYYAFQAVFAGLRYADRRFRGPENDRWTAQAAEVGETVARLREQLDAERSSLGLQPPITPESHEERFEPIEATALRIAIEATHNGGRASLDELEAWSVGAEPINVALADRGGKASASSFALENQTRHPDNLIDGRSVAEGYFPWIAERPGPAWARIELPDAVTLDRIVWRRGFDGFPVAYEIEIRRPDGSWVTVADTRSRMLHEEDRRAAGDIAIDGIPPEQVERLAALVAKIRDGKAEQGRLEAGPQVFAGGFGRPEPTYLLRRGDPMQRQEEVEPNTPVVLGSLGLSTEADDAGRREALARHLTSPDHPLTARVMVNRIWQHHFGTGLVSSPSDFGRMGELPSHPELLDWLAIEFIQSGWSVKHLHRLMLGSGAFRQASTPRDDALAIDAESRLLWRFPPRRLEGEAIRDAILLASGSLNRDMSGPGFDFFNQRGGLSDYIPVDHDDPSGWRRMIYAIKIRMQAVDVFGSFDCPDAGQMIPKRTQSITPIQALSLWNSTFVMRQAGLFAGRVRGEAGSDLSAQVDRAVWLALGRPPTAVEAEQLLALGREHGLEQVCRVLLNTNAFLLID
ncbi:PSD1 and planctomycete cytochrome C domain-containing protein [Tautonia sp. JC769]|uniref:PSD1 and planctomycete cytochrome C domain-containing protein n=1 Tax=Tautonia sp. JC769 TaxID=3232135 RepID=UPI00345749DA